MRRLILALSILTIGCVCTSVFAQEYVDSIPGDGIPDFYYFRADSAMPPGAIYAGEVFPAGSFIIDPDGPDFGLTTIIVEGPPALGFDTMPNPASRANGSAAIPGFPTAAEMAMHSLPGSIVTQDLGPRWPLPTYPGSWLDDKELYADNRAIIEFNTFGYREWAVGYVNNTMQLGMLSGQPLGQVPGHPEDVKDILTKGLIYERGSQRPCSVTFADSSGKMMKTRVNDMALTSYACSEIVIDSSTTIDYAVHDNLRIVQGANPPSVVDVVSPARLDSSLMADIDVYDSSVLNFAGRGDWHISAYDSSIVSMSAGRAIYLDVHEASASNVSGGSIYDLTTNDNSSLSVSGGRIVYLTSLDSSTVDMSEGEIVASIWAGGSSTLTISGGTCCNEAIGVSGSGTLSVSGGRIDALIWAHDSGTVNIYGTAFNYDYGTIPDEDGRIFGTLKNGDPIDISFSIRDSASIILVVPEPSTLLMLAVVGMTFGGIAWRRRRK